MPFTRHPNTVRDSRKRRLNGRLLLCLVLAAILLAAGVSQIHKRQVRRNAGVLLEQASRAEALGDRRKAEELLRLFLGYQPNHAAAVAKKDLEMGLG